jgi:COMPASS component SWD1
MFFFSPKFSLVGCITHWLDMCSSPCNVSIPLSLSFSLYVYKHEPSIFSIRSQGITAVAWVPPSGRRLVTGSLDGKVCVWDVLSGEIVLHLDLGCGAVTGLSIPRDAAFDTVVLVNFASEPAQLVSLRGSAEAVLAAARKLPAVAIVGKGSGMQLELGAAAAAYGQPAVLSADGAVAFAACRGALIVVRCADLALLDLVRIPGSPMVKSLKVDRDGKRLLVVAEDKTIRVYDIVPPGPEAHATAIKDLSFLPAAAQMFSKSGSVMWCAKLAATAPGAARNAPDPPLLSLSRIFGADVEPRSWADAAFSPDGEHVAACVQGGEQHEHIIYIWSVSFGFHEATLEGGRDKASALAWHPAPVPLQLLALGAAGVAFVWTRAFSQSWSAFAPDFEELPANREYFEEEDEFDVNPREEDGGAAAVNGAAAGAVISGHGDAESDDLDIVGLDGADEAIAVRGVEVGELPLLRLPVVWDEDEDVDVVGRGTEGGDRMEVEGVTVIVEGAAGEEEGRRREGDN